MSIEMLEENFNLVSGLKLPVLYIEKATVNNSSIILRVSFYIKQTIDKDITIILEPLADLKFYIARIIDGTPSVTDDSITYLDEQINGTNYFESLKSGTITTYEYLVNTFSVSPLYDVFSGQEESHVYIYNKFLTMLEMSNFEIAKTEITEDEVHKIIKMSAETSIEIFSYPGDSASVADFPGFDAFLDSETFLNADDLNLNLSLVTFTSPLTLNEANSEYTPSYSDENKTRIINLTDPFLSQISHQKIFEDGEILIQPIEVYSFEDGTIYNNDVIQTIDGDYHPSENPTRQQIYSEFLSLSDGIEDASEAFTAAIDGYKYILQIYGNTEELLPRLNVFRQTYLDKSTSTTMGRWYQTFNTTLIRINSSVRNTQILRRELITTPVVVDNRDFSEINYTQPEESTYDLASDYLFSNLGSFLMTRTGYNDGSVEHAYDLFENGFFFFDYEKAIRTQTVISKLFDITQVENLLGSQIMNKYFKLLNVSFERRNNQNDDDTLVYSKLSSFNDSLSATYPEHTETRLYNGAEHEGSNSYIMYDLASEELYPELFIRNMTIPGNEFFNNYRMMTFQYQEILKTKASYVASSRDNDYFNIQLECTDHTKQLVQELIDIYSNYANENFAEYLEAAQDFCSYNNVDGYFNDFFIEAMNSAYEDLQSSPWVIMPIMFNIFRDLLSKLFDGSSEKITNISINISESIAPATGTLENLLSFNENVQTIIDFFQSETFVNLLDSYENNERVTFTGQIGSETETISELYGPPTLTVISSDDS